MKKSRSVFRISFRTSGSRELLKMWLKAAGRICCHKGGNPQLEERRWSFSSHLFVLDVEVSQRRDVGHKAHLEVSVNQLGLRSDPSEVGLQLEGVSGWRRQVHLRQGGGAGWFGWRRGSLLDWFSRGSEERVNYKQIFSHFSDAMKMFPTGQMCGCRSSPPFWSSWRWETRTEETLHRSSSPLPGPTTWTPPPQVQRSRRWSPGCGSSLEVSDNREKK